MLKVKEVLCSNACDLIDTCPECNLVVIRQQCEIVQYCGECNRTWPAIQMENNGERSRWISFSDI